MPASIKCALRTTLPSTVSLQAKVSGDLRLVKDEPPISARSRWAAVLLNAEAYAEVIDRHVELATELDALRSLLDYLEPIDDDRWRRRESQSNPAVQWIPELEHRFDDDWLADRVVAIAQLAEELDRGTLKLALRIVPFQWWTARHGTDTEVVPGLVEL
jgi:hypothetical protein